MRQGKRGESTRDMWRMEREKRQREKSLLRQRLARDMTQGGPSWRKALQQADLLPAKRASTHEPPPGFLNSAIPFSDDDFDLEEEQFQHLRKKFEKQKM